ncbi:hypothetical protein [Pseudomonas sp. B21-053]|uniref:hypothetical protein n=1 Tax=Pseudomonas sp. B21-053 TaxID=2895493 RepID=UPI00223129D1|nr:hypothetical protein [Pseudomonas sp. B21-053]UZE10328.1 hypothetical protein LOY68_22870 [Pseudomonas sp. B21-053]
MKIDFRILGAVSFFVVLAIGTLYFTRWEGTESVSTVAVSEGLQVEVATSGVDFELKDCDVGRYEDPFFLHAYPVDSSKAGPEGFINMDFSLKSLKPKSTSTRAGVSYCKYRVDFGAVAVDRVALGQFKFTTGACCDVLWTKQINVNK